MDKNKLISELGKNTELRFKNPYYANIFRSLSFSNFQEKELAEVIGLMCKNIEENTENLIKYINKYGYLE